MAGPKTLRSLSCLLDYPTEETIEAAELLYIILQGELPEAAKEMSDFGVFLDSHEHWQIEETFSNTFDVNPECALEIGWHLFGEEYARGMFLVRMRKELRKYNLEESTELPDHVTHVLAVVGAMPEEEAEHFVTSCVLPAIKKMYVTMEGKDSPYRHVISCLALVLNHVWGEGGSLTDFSEVTHVDSSGVPDGVDLLHAFPVAGLSMGCGSGGCGDGCGSPEPQNLVQISSDLSQERSDLR